MMKLNDKFAISEIDLEHVGGGRKYTDEEIEDILATHDRACDVVQILERYGRTDDLNKFYSDFHDAVNAYDRRIVDDSIEPNTLKFSEFYNQNYGWPK